MRDAATRLADRLIGMVQRRIRMLSVLAMTGMGWLILTQDLSWSQILPIAAGVGVLACLALGFAAWSWFVRNARGQRER